MMLVLAGATACGASSGRGNSGLIRIAVYPGSLMSLPVFIGDSAGIFKRNGLDARLIKISNGPAMTAALVSGSVDIDLNSVDNNIVARQSGKDIVAVAGNLMTSPFSLIASKNQPVPNLSKGFPYSVRDLKGATIGVMATGGSVEAAARYVIRQAGLNPDKDVKLLNVGLPGTGIPALKAGRINAYMAIEPAQSTATVDGIGKVVLDLRENSLPPQLALTDWPYNQWGSTPSTIKKKSAVIAKFQKAMKDVYAYMADKNNVPAINKIALAQISDNPALVGSMLESNLSTFGYDMPRARVDNAFKYLVTTGLSKKNVTYDDYVAVGARSSS